jgi:glycosyltransferase involved in cell wall biosynthesis
VLPYVVRAAARIITGSEFTRSELAELLNVAEGKIRVIPYGVGAPFATDGPAADGHYVLAVSTLEPRKNLARLVEAFDRFDDTLADRVMEESLAVRSVERSVEDLMLPALDSIRDRDGREAEYELACRWATGWLHAARRVVPAASRSEGILLFDSSSRLDLESLHVQALELALRRAGFRVLLLSMGLAQERLSRAMRALEPSALVVCGSGATLDVVGRLVYAVRHTGSSARVYEYREAMPVAGSHAIPSIGASPIEATTHMKAIADGRRLDTAADMPELGQLRSSA